MTALDWVVMLLLSASAMLGLVRGVVVEIFSLASWILAFLAAQWGAAVVGPFLPVELSGGLRYFAGFVAVFIVAIFVVLLLGRLVKGAVGAVGMGGVDKAVGGVFGLLRGLVILAGLALAAGLTALPQTDFWKNALSSRLLESLAMAVEPLLPARLVEHIHYNR